jgi:hypothetical protein
VVKSLDMESLGLELVEMMELMSYQALETGAQRRREVVLDAMRAARASNTRLRQIAGMVLVGIGQMIAGERPVASARLRTSSDCL